MWDKSTCFGLAGLLIKVVSGKTGFVRIRADRRPVMQLVGFTVKNYKSIREPVTVKPLTTGNCLIGPNNEGKSSVLEATESASSQPVHPRQANA